MANTVTWETLYWLVAALAAWGAAVGLLVWRACTAIERINTRLTVIETRMEGK